MNRGFLFGDGFFETIRIINGTIPLLFSHLERIDEAVQIYDLHPAFDIDDEFITAIAKEYESNGILRINFFRDGEGKYNPTDNGMAPGTSSGSPARSAAMRATLRLSSPAWLAQPITRSSTWVQSTPGLRAISALRGIAARSSVRTAESAPP